jgi:transcriptional regulator with XRE-family HTH domain
MSIAHEVSRNIKRRREQLRLSQVEVARRARERTGIVLHPAMISRYEREEQRPGIDKIEALAAALACTVADLMTPGWEPQLPEGF